jgi:hypothetical protein
VDTPHGKQAIVSLRVGDQVDAENPATGTVEAEPVLAVIDDGIKPLLQLDLADGSSLKVTANHPFYVDAGPVRTAAGWMYAGDLRVGDRLRTVDGHGLSVISIRDNMGTAHVYTLTVAKDHTFFVGGGVPVLVHNCGGSPTQLSLFSQEELDRVGGADTIDSNTGSALTYQTYTKTNPDTGEVYVGRTGGFGSASENIARRDAVHEYSGRGFQRAVLDQTSFSKPAIRGREQQLIEYYRGQGKSANRINGAGPRNKRIDSYLAAAFREFGALP